MNSIRKKIGAALVCLGALAGSNVATASFVQTCNYGIYPLSGKPTMWQSVVIDWQTALFYSSLTMVNVESSDVHFTNPIGGEVYSFYIPYAGISRDNVFLPPHHSWWWLRADAAIAGLVWIAGSPIIYTDGRNCTETGAFGP